MWEVQCFLRQQHHRPAAAAIISAFWNNRCGQTLEYSAWSVKINWHKVPLIWRGDAKYDREMQLALDQSERKLQCWHPPWSRVIMWFMSSSCTAMNTQYHEASEYLPHMAGVLSAQGAIFTFPIQLFSWLACSVTRPLQSPVSGLRLVQTYLPPLSPSQSRLETQLSQSRVFPPSLTQFSDSQRQRSRRVPEKSLAVILVTILRVFSSHCMQWGACSSPLQASPHPLLQNEVCSAKPTAVHMLSLKYCQNSW